MAYATVSARMIAASGSLTLCLILHCAYLLVTSFPDEDHAPASPLLRIACTCRVVAAIPRPYAWWRIYSLHSEARKQRSSLRVAQRCLAASKDRWVRLNDCLSRVYNVWLLCVVFRVMHGYITEGEHRSDFEPLRGSTKCRPASPSTRGPTGPLGGLGLPTDAGTDAEQLESVRRPQELAAGRQNTRAAGLFPPPTQEAPLRPRDAVRCVDRVDAPARRGLHADAHLLPARLPRRREDAPARHARALLALPDRGSAAVRRARRRPVHHLLRRLRGRPADAPPHAVRSHLPHRCDSAVSSPFTSSPAACLPPPSPRWRGAPLRPADLTRRNPRPNARVPPSAIPVPAQRASTRGWSGGCARCRASRAPSARCSSATTPRTRPATATPPSRATSRGSPSCGGTTRASSGDAPAVRRAGQVRCASEVRGASGRSMVHGERQACTARSDVWWICVTIL